ncbi:hypothetical protein P679_2037 [Acinetobacter baumannii UH7907]|nr:hypothetical protein P679_2037 [Acinetobacter baumannii UH7907]
MLSYHGSVLHRIDDLEINQELEDFDAYVLHRIDDLEIKIVC